MLQGCYGRVTSETRPESEGPGQLKSVLSITFCLVGGAWDLLSGWGGTFTEQAATLGFSGFFTPPVKGPPASAWFMMDPSALLGPNIDPLPSVCPGTGFSAPDLNPLPSHLVTSGHQWSPVVTSGHTGRLAPHQTSSQKI